MRTRFAQALQILQDTFWLVPAALVMGGLGGAELLVQIERAGLVPRWLLSGWLYDGGGGGARTLLGAIASSTIGVAGTIFSITIASLALASSQMGPRLLSNFTRDRGNQVTLGLYLGTFAYALMVLRAVRSPSEGAFTPHLAVSVGVALALGCVALLVYFVHHMAGRINVDTVIGLVHEDFRRSIDRLTLAQPDAAPHADDWIAACTVTDDRHGYLQNLDEQGLADFADRAGVCLRLFVRPGDFVFPGAPIIEASGLVNGLKPALLAATGVGPKQIGAADLEFSVRQLVDIAVRALSPGINDPQTAVSVLDRMGAGLCEISGRHLLTGVVLRGEHVRLTRPAIDYAGLVDAGFNPIRQNAAGSASVLIHMVEVLTSVASSERDPARRAVLELHVDRVAAAAERAGIEPDALDDLRIRCATFRALQLMPLSAAPIGFNASKAPP